MVSIIREEILLLKDKGVDFIQLDEPVLTEVLFGEEAKETFMCAALTYKTDPSEELDMAKNLVNEVVKGIVGVKLGLHVCRGNWSKKEEVLLKGEYAPLLPYLMDMKVDQLVLEFSTPRAGGLEALKEYANEKEIGYGVVNPRSDEVEPPKLILSRVKELLKFYDPSKIYLNPDCGFGTFAERPVATARLAFEKLKNMVEAARELRREYGD
ncbi:5-methyltetrahydropteroyltriglutamate--homocysteine methyltransferase [archaeon HR06]|nr:5-methyltetrahydropteroyltriglutamate--homocysteine methyltransferase [archaeon HR06]